MSYKSDMKEPIPKYWKCTVNDPNKTGGYTATRYVGVVAMDCLEALQAIKEKHPNCIIVSINHEGPVDVLSIDGV